MLEAFVWVLQGGTSSAAFALVQHCGFTSFTLENTGQGAARLGSVTVLSVHTSQGGTKPQFFSQGSSGRRAAVGRGASTTQSPALGMEQMLCKCSSVGHLCSVEDSRTGTLPVPRLGYHLQLGILSFTQQREVGGFLSLSKDLSPVYR